jgi:hypothetical protein
MAKYKENPKEVINIITLVEGYISRLNSSCVEYKVPKVYSLEIIDSKTTLSMQDIQRGESPKKCKQLRLTVSNLDNNERLTLYTLDYVPTNPADLLTAPYKRTLYRQFLYECLGVFGNTIENHLRQEQAKKIIESASLKKSNAERPLTPNQAFKK